ncbi:hypothetical protein L345_13003, partial [Ophiophagus hannah]
MLIPLISRKNWKPGPGGLWLCLEQKPADQRDPPPQLEDYWGLKERKDKVSGVPTGLLKAPLYIGVLSVLLFPVTHLKGFSLLVSLGDEVAAALVYSDLWSFFTLTTIATFHGHMIKIQMLGNWFLFMTVSVSRGHAIPFCDFLTSKVNGEASSAVSDFFALLDRKSVSENCAASVQMK